LISRESACPASPVTAIGRLKTREEFLHVRDGTRFAAPTLVLQALARADAGEAESEAARFGFTATKRLGGAVQRNRARRRLKEAVRLVGPDHATAGYDYVLIARAGTLQRPFADITKDLERALAKVHQAPRPQPAPKTVTRDSLPPLPRDRAKPGQP
jgi:ribonuclease P protein component